MVHDDRFIREYWYRLSGSVQQEHDGLRAGALRILYRASVRHGFARHALETRYPHGGILGIASRSKLFRNHIPPDEI